MSQLNSEIGGSVLETVSGQLGESIDALNRTFDAKFEIEVGEVQSASRAEISAAMAGEGLALSMKFQEEGFLFLVVQLDQFIPHWCQAPDATGESKLATLSQELGMTMVPGDFMPEDYVARYVASLSEAISATQLADSATGLSMKLTANGLTTRAILLWPVTDAMNLKAASPVAQIDSEAAVPESVTRDTSSVQAKPASSASQAGGSNVAADLPVEKNLHHLPRFTRSLLRIEIPMSVKIVSAKRPISKLLEIGPGSILQFEKNCEAPLILEANNEPIAEGTAIRIGDRFGLQISEILMPKERFWTVQPPGDTG